MLRAKIENKAVDIKTGSILMAKPFWGDELYHRSVILVTKHNAEGSQGVMINKESKWKIEMLLRGMSVAVPVYFGGPMDKNSIISLHNQQGVNESTELNKGLYLSGGSDVLKETMTSHNFDFTKVRFFSGHVAWDKGQLEQEVSDGKWWISGVVKSKELFSTDADLLWSSKLLKDGHIYGIFHDAPDPSLN